METDNASCYTNRLNFYFNVARGMNYIKFIDLLKKSANEDLDDTILLTFFLRDCRGGKGERFLGRWGFQWLWLNFPEKINKIINCIPDFGRWDDLLVFFPNCTTLERVDNYLTEIKNPEQLNLLKVGQQAAVDLFIAQLKQDYTNVVSNQKSPVSLCAKWAPSENCALDRKYNLVTTICQRWGISKRRYRKNLSTIRKYLHIPERYLAQKEGQVRYAQLPIGSIRKYSNAFKKRDYKKFMKYLYQRSSQKITNIDNVLPHKIIEQYNPAGYHEILRYTNEKIETAWNEYYVSFPYHESWENTVFFLDVSGSMYSRKYSGMDKVPINLGLALGILTQKRIYNLRTTSEFTEVTGNTLLEVIRKVVDMQYQNEIDFDEMIKDVPENHNVFIVSDQDIRFQKEYPFMITVWNPSRAYIDIKEEKNVKYVYGYSPIIVQQILAAPHIPPIHTIQKIFERNRYKNIKNLL